MEPIVVLNLYLSSIAFPPVGQYHGFFLYTKLKSYLLIKEAEFRKLLQ